MYKAAFLNAGRLSRNINHRNISRKSVKQIAPSCIDVLLKGYHFESAKKVTSSTSD